MLPQADLRLIIEENACPHAQAAGKGCEKLCLNWGAQARKVHRAAYYRLAMPPGPLQASIYLFCVLNAIMNASSCCCLFIYPRLVDPFAMEKAWYIGVDIQHLVRETFTRKMSQKKRQRLFKSFLVAPVLLA
jgi:hypothetical protein